MSKRKDCIGNIGVIKVAVGWVFLHHELSKFLLVLISDCCLDVEWLSEDMFASAGADQQIFIMKIDEDEPIKVLKCVRLLSG